MIWLALAALGLAAVWTVCSMIRDGVEWKLDWKPTHPFGTKEQDELHD